MADVIPFKCWRLQPERAAEAAANPYDTFSREEAAREIAARPLSFLRIDKPSALFGDETGEYDPKVYIRAREELDAWYEQGIMVPDSEPPQPVYLIYRLTKGDHTQIGIVACASVADYLNGVIKRHEDTRPEKERDRVDHILALEAHTSPVLLVYPNRPKLDAVLREYADTMSPINDFTAPDGVRHILWRVDDANTIEFIRSALSDIPTLYIADGHHRAAAAARVCALNEASGATCHTEANYFLAALFGSDDLQVLDYNRVVSDLAGLEPAELLEQLGEVVDVKLVGSSPYRPTQRGELGMYLEGSWYALHIREDARPSDAVEGLDVALLQSMILEPILAIDDPRSNQRISYVGGIRGLTELASRADRTGGVAFVLYPCSLTELFTVADEDRMMPPKSTWFEPKLLSGLIIHKLTP